MVARGLAVQQSLAAAEPEFVDEAVQCPAAARTEALGRRPPDLSWRSSRQFCALRNVVVEIAAAADVAAAAFGAKTADAYCSEAVAAGADTTPYRGAGPAGVAFAAAAIGIVAPGAVPAAVAAEHVAPCSGSASVGIGCELDRH